MSKRIDISNAGGADQVGFSIEERDLADRFIMALRRMDDRHRRAALSLVDAAEDVARKHPRRAAAGLRLVAGGAA